MNRFSCHVDVDYDDLIPRDHRVHAVRVVPGVTFFDLVLRALQARGIDVWRLELADVLFSEPVAVDAGRGRRVELTVEERAPQVWAVRAASRASDEADAPLRENFACTARYADAPAPAPQALRAGGESLDLDVAYAHARAVGIEHFDFMKGEGRIDFGPQRLIAHLQPSELARAHADTFLLHPACLDSATLVPFLAAVHGDERGPQPFIPIHVRRFRAWAPVRGRCAVVVERADCVVQDDVFRSDIVLCDPDTGACLARLEGLTTKRIRSPQLLERLLRPPVATAPQAAPAVDALPAIATASIAATVQADADPAQRTPQALAERLIRELIAGERAAADPGGSAALDADTGFYDLGLESSHLLSISARLGERLAVSLYPTLLFEHSSIAELAAHLAASYAPALAQCFPVAASAPVEPTPTPAPATVAPPAAASLAPQLPSADEPIAVIGLAGRYADAADVESLWHDILAPGRDCIGEIPRERWDADRWFDPDRRRDDRSYAKWGSFLPAIDRFDPVAFAISPREADLMDPQERLFLETASDTFGAAGYAARALAGSRTGVFVGVMWRQYETLGAQRAALGDASALPMSFSASVANRVSHHFDLRGPSLALDSMCSSSLSALHLACESLRRGESDLALAGGVNLMVHPSKYLYLSRQQMLASDGRCRSFGEGGDGYVPGEGVGAVLLKRLSQAQRDGDAILGVIRASALNHGGRAGGYTVPDPDAQADVVARTLASAGLTAQAIGYVEAHGTGTSLGDPIEVRGLEKAYGGARGADAPACAIGSIKSNLGHLEAAAGIAGLTKLLLQLRHRRLAPSLHAQRLNPHIDFERAGFAVQREGADWAAGADGLRRAGLSSFGAGGSNAHLIVEEYPTHARAAGVGPRLIVLSARSRAQLESGAARLRAHLARVAESRLQPDLDSVAHTLMSRDDAHGVRAAIVVDSLVALRAALADLDGAGWRRGEPGRRREAARAFAPDASREALDAVALAYVDGAGLAPQTPDGTAPAQRCALPTWPFLGRRCWLPDPAAHPLLGRRESTPNGVRFERKLAREEAWLEQHRVDGVPALPGVGVALAMLAAADAATSNNATRQALRDVRWTRLAAAPEHGEAPWLSVECEGAAVRASFDGVACAQAQSAPLDAAAPSLSLAAIRARCARTLPVEACYRALAERGLRYGADLRALRRLDLGQDEALAEIDGAGGADLPPSLSALDSALQAVTALLDEDAAPQRWRPAGIGWFALWGQAPARGLAHVRVIERSRARVRFDIDLADAQGQGWASLHGVELRLAVSAAPASAPAAALDPIRCVSERWVDEAPAPAAEPPQGPVLVFERDDAPLADELAARIAAPVIAVRAGAGFARLSAQRYAIRPGHADDIAELLAQLDAQSLRPRALVHAWARALDASTLQRELDNGAHTLVAWFNRWFARRPTPLRVLYLHPPGEPVHAAVEGLARTAGREHPALAMTTVEVDAAADSADVVTTELAAVSDPAPVRWQDGRRRRLRRFEAEAVAAAVDEVRRGRVGRDWSALTAGRAAPVCLISGGLGGLGRHLALALAREAGARVVLAGRRSAHEVESELAELRTRLPALTYRQADLSDEAQARDLVEAIVREHGALDVVVHSAGVVRDGLLNRLNRADVDAVLAAKVHGALALDRATRHLPLAAFVAFSSVSGMIGNPGQAAYGYANRFLDRLAEIRAEAVAAGRAHGRSWSIAWPLWRDGGMRVDAGTEALLERSLGMRPLQSEDGLACLHAVGASAAALVGFVAGDLPRIDAALALRADADSKPAAPQTTASATASAPTEARRRLLRERVSALLMLEPDTIDLDAGADDLGLDPTHLAALASDLQPSATVRLTALRIRELPRLAALADLLSPDSGEPLEPEFDTESRASADAAPGNDGAQNAGGYASQSLLQARQDALATIRRSVADLLGLGVAEVDADAPLREFGIDSITIVELTERLGRTFGVALAPAAVFELERVADLVDMVEAAGGLARAVAAAAPLPAQAEAPRAAGARSASTASTSNDESPVSARADDIAIVGMAGRFPGAPDLDGFWRNLVEMRDSIGEIPADRWDWRAIDGDALSAPDRTRARWGGFIEGVDRFDAEFFRISPKQAEWMDPQHRLMLEATWAALADAGCDPDALRGSRAGVFVGIGTSDYHDRARALALPAEAQSALGRAHSLLPNRISYLLDLHGPSLPFETACSSSLVAVDQAVAALRAGRCTLALVGGVNLILDPYLSVSFDRAGMLSPRGRCRAFDAGADGYVRGEGLGMIVLKPLQQALADGDRVRAVVKGCAVNHGGVAHALTAPNPRSQARLLVDAYRDADVDPLSLGYIEAHGTGTALGDPIEVRGLLAALDELHRQRGRERAPPGHCALGSVKANIGHLETAAGIAGLIKTVLCLEQRTIPGLAHFQAINPQIALAGTPLRIAENTQEWPAPHDGGPRRAGVSSFGFGGSNAHVVLEEAPAQHRARVAPRPAPVFAHARYWLEAPPRERAVAAPERTAAAAQTQAEAATAIPLVREADDAARASVLEELTELLARVAKIPRERIAADADFERYGLDSVLILELNHALRARFGELPATVFYTYKTPAALAGFLARHRSANAPVATAAPTTIDNAAADERGDIAVIGVAGRYPGAATLDALWANLLEGRHAIDEIPASRWDWRRYFDPEPKPGRMYCKWGGFIDDVDRFDAGFFGVAPWLARYMDPQERLFLEQAWACVEDAGYAPASLGAASADGERRAPVGVFVGASYNEYATLAAEANALRGEGAPFNTQSFSIANRVSYCLGLGGPSMTVDTACSASLNAVHLACESLRSGACELAIAGGVNLSLHPNKYLMLCANRFAAADGRCRAFGEGGQGYVPGEGVGAVLLKPLAAAQRDGDAIHAVIRGSAVNHDGKTFGYTVPNPVAQTEVIRSAWKRSGVDPRSIGYIEAHGTGTHLGDPIEIAGLSEAFASDERGFCAIGSVKSNIGHLEAAAGIAALHKAVLQLRHATLVPSLLHAERLNPAIAFADTPFRVQTERAPWVAAEGRPLRAGVSSFGAGGVNAHVLLEQWRAPARAAAVDDAGPVLVLLSARDSERLTVAAARLLAHVEQGFVGDAQALHDLAFTLQTGREAFAPRLALVAGDVGELMRGLRAFLAQAQTDASAGVFVGHASSPHSGDAAKLSEAFAHGELASLAQAWVDGCDWPWAHAHAPGVRRRLHLPTYPFAGERYWIDAAPASAAAVVEVAPVAATGVVSEALAGFRAAVPAARAAACERLVATLVAEVLEFERGRLPDPQTGLFAMGMESVQSARLVTRLEQALGLTLYPTLVFDCPSIRELARELIVRVDAEPAPAATSAPATAAQERVLATPQWQSAPTPSPSVSPAHCVAVALAEPLRAQLSQHLEVREEDALETLLRDPADTPLLIADGSLLEAAPDAFARAFALAKRLLHGKRTVEWAMPYPLDRDGEGAPDARGLSAFARSLAMEAPRVRLRLIGVDVDAPAAATAERILAEAAQAQYEPELRYRDGRRERRALIERTQAPAVADWPQDAVVLVSGGLGGLGLKVAERLGRSGARLALLSRSEPTPEQRQRLDALTQAGAQVVCVRGDVSVRAQVDAAVAAVRERFGRLDAVIHAAGCLRDVLLTSKSPAAAAAVLSPKLDGCRHLDEATAALPLRCFAVFASTAGLTGNIGQTDYAFANAWLDGFAHQRARAAADGHRRGRTLAFDWPLWADGGMRVSEDSLAFMAHRAGFAPMPDEDGLDLLERALAAGDGQYAVFYGDGARIRGQFLAAAEVAPATPPATAIAHEAPLAGAEDPDDAIAIVGMACRFPGGCDSPEALWTLLDEGRDAIGPAPAPRWSRVAVAVAADGDNGLRDGGFLTEDPALFDAGLFGISPREAAEMDPQQRLLLEVAWHALEDSGIAADTLAGSDTGVFVGITGSEYGQLPRAADALNGYTVTGLAPNIAAGRVARALGAHGPALTVDTACSSSLMAVHLARQSLLRGESALAVAAGVNLLLSPDTFLALARMGALAPDGRCKTFAASADGYGRGEGCGVVVLERLADARRNGRRVLAVIRGSAANHDGASSGLTVPNGRAQTRLLQRALADARLDPDQVDAIEAHGTGTPLGDPIELRAIAEVYGRRGDRRALAVGAVKANLGHLEAAAGIAGLIKAVQCVRHGRMPAQPGLDAAAMNPRIALPPAVELALAERSPAATRVVGVSAFGFSGTNVHVLVGAAPELTPTLRTAAPQRAAQRLLCLSAASPAALTALAARWRERIAAANEDELSGLCAASVNARARLRHRAAVSGADAHSLVEALDALAAGRDHARAWCSCDSGAEDAPAVALWVPDALAATDTAEALAAQDADVAATLALRRQRTAARPHAAGFAEASVVVEALRRCGVRPAQVLARGRSLAFAAWAAGLLEFDDAAALAADERAAVRWREADAALIDLASGRALQSSEVSAAMRATLDTEVAPRVDVGALLALGATDAPDVWPLQTLAGWCAALAGLHVRGVRIERTDCFGEAVAVADVPKYPMQRRAYWIACATTAAAEQPAVVPAAASASVESPLDPIDVQREGARRSLRYRWSHARLPDLADNHGVLHIGQYLELLLRAVRAEFGLDAVHLDEVEFRNALRLTPDEQRETTLTLEHDGAALQWSLSGTGGTIHACGRLRALAQDEAPSAQSLRVDEPAQDRAGFYARMAQLSFDLGPSVRWIERVAAGAGEACARFVADPALSAASAADVRALGFHPGVLDAGAQLVAAAAAQALADGTRFMVVGMEAVRIPASSAVAQAGLHGRLRLLPESDGLLCASLALYDGEERCVLAIDRLRLRRLAARDVSRIESASKPARVVDADDARAFVRERVAAALDMQASELHAGVPLREMGIDSIVGLGLVRELSDGLGVDVPAELLLAGPSIDALLTQLRLPAAAQAPAPGRWFENVVRRARPRARLLCLPFGAGAASAYRRWSALDPAIEVWPVQLPGRETRIGERPFDDLDALLDALCAQLPDEPDLPLALYGQSMGGLIAFELARRLQSEGRRPAHLFIGGLSAPDIQPNPYLASLRARLRARGLDDLPAPGSERVPDAFWEVFREMPEVAGQGFDHLRPILPMVLADLALVDRYRHRAEPALDVPITVLHGLHDDRVPRASLAGWSALSRAPVRQIAIDGDHFFIQDERALPAVAAAIAAALLAAPDLHHDLHLDLREPTCHASI